MEISKKNTKKKGKYLYSHINCGYFSYINSVGIIIYLRTKNMKMQKIILIHPKNNVNSLCNLKNLFANGQ